MIQRAFSHALAAEEGRCKCNEAGGMALLARSTPNAARARDIFQMAKKQKNEREAKEMQRV
jgi:hypothetical protein